MHSVSYTGDWYFEEKEEGLAEYSESELLSSTVILLELSPRPPVVRFLSVERTGTAES